MADSAVIYARVSPEVHDAVKALASASGCSIALTVDVLLRRSLGLPDKLRSLSELLDGVKQCHLCARVGP